MKTQYHHLAQSILVTVAAMGFGLVAATPVHAGTYYWDTDGAGTAGFGTASGAWGTDAFWGTDAAGGGATANTTITTVDDVNFGTAIDGLAAGTITGPASAQGFLNMTFGAASGAITISGGRLDLDATTGSTITVDNTINSISTVLQGAGGKLIKTGLGRVTLTTTQAYTGETVVDAGILALAAGNTQDSGLYTSSAITINDGGQILVTGDNALQGYRTTVVAPVVINSGGTLTSSNGVTAHIRGGLELEGGTLAAGTPDPQYGTWTLDGDVTILGTGTSLMSASQMNWPQGVERTFTVLEADGILNVTGSFARPGTFPGAGGPAFLGSLTKDGPGTMILSGANNYTGATTVYADGGKLSLGNGSARSSSGFAVGENATLELNGVNIFVPNHTTPVAATRMITVDGGTLLMTANTEVRIGNVTLSNGATWTSNRTLAYYDILLADTDSGPATVSVTGNAPSVMDGSGGIHLEGVQNFDVADVTGNADADLTVGMTLADRLFATPAAGGISKSGDGTMRLDNTNTYTGPTVVNAGTLAIGTLGTLASSTVSIAAGATLDTTALATFTCPGALEFGLDASGTSGHINATGQALVISGTAVTFNVNGPLTAPAYVLATYGSLSGIPAFASITPPGGYDITYDFNGGTQIALVQISDPFQSWVASTAFGLAPADQSPSADPDVDGMDNLLEFVINGNPAVSDPAILPDLVVTDDAFEFTFARRNDSLAPVTTQTFQYGTNLDGWTDVVVPADSDIVGMATITVIDGSPADTVKISVPKSEAGLTGKLFGRLRVTRP